MKTIYFEDKGQDFLEWQIQRGQITGSRPFQSSIWVGHKVKNIRVGSYPRILLEGNKWTTMNYRILKIVNHLL